jgi:hypothetical protein
LGERVAAVVRRRPDHVVTEEELITFLRGRLADYNADLDPAEFARERWW